MSRAKTLLKSIEKKQLKENCSDERFFGNRQLRDWENYVRKSYDALINDPDRKERIKKRLCKRCFYREGYLCGQAFTTFNCHACNKEQTHPNTAVDSLCWDCANLLRICIHCCANL